MAEGQQPLTWETSANNKPEVSDTLPDQVVTCLNNAKYLHLATCTDYKPHVSLMNYTYIASHPFESKPKEPSAPEATTLPTGPIIVMTSNPSSQKTRNLTQNPNVSLLVHDWVSTRPPPPNPGASPPLQAEGTTSAGRPGGGAGRSSLATLLMGMNSSEMGSISATINGTAAVLKRGTEVEKWCKEQHLKLNGLDDRPATTATNGTGSGSISQLSGSPNMTFQTPAESTSGAEDDVRVVVVSIRDGRISDTKGTVRDFILASADQS